MRKCLRKISKMPAVQSKFLRVQSNMVGVSQKLFKQQLRLFELTGARQALDIPKRAGREATLSTSEPVHMRALRLVAENQGIFNQMFLDGSHRRKPHRIHRTDESHQRH